MPPRIDRRWPEDLEDYLDLCRLHAEFNVPAALMLTAASLRYASGRAKADEADREPLAALEREWYASVEAGAPNYGVYNDPRFLCDLWSCWVAYSHAHLKAMLAKRKQLGGRSIVDEVGDGGVIVDLGCGTGYATAALAEMFPNGAVFGTNIEGTCQFRIAQDVAAGTGGAFTVVGCVEKVGRKADLVFASEYFEHFEEPFAHLREVVETLEPSFLVIANSFSAKAIGHFPVYRDGAESVPNVRAGRRFNTQLRKHGYEPVETGFWNGRPAYWRKQR